MSSNTSFNIVPKLFLTLFFISLSLFGASSVTGQVKEALTSMPGNEYGCTVSKVEQMGNSDEVLLHAVGCNGSEKTKTFLVDMVAMKLVIADTRFFAGVKNGDVFNFGVRGVNVGSMDLTPRVVSIDADMWPY